jgi:transcriptional regulator with XRE-family HTH domain
VSLGSHLRQMRASRGLSLRQLAQASRVNPSTLSRWESDATCPRVYELEAVLTALRASDSERALAWQQLNAPRAVRVITTESLSLVLPARAAPIGGELLKAMRRRRGWTLEQVAFHVGVTVSTVSRWERSEGWPSEQQLSHLCAVLGASEAEHAALQGGRGVLHWLPFPAASACDLAGLLEAVRTHQIPIEPALMELVYSCIEGRVWQLVGCGKAQVGLLLDAYAYHCSWLVEQARIQEAQQPASRALRLFERVHSMRPHWFGVLHALAKGAAELGSRPSPLEGVAILRRWLPHAEQHAPEYEAWFLRDIAEYLSFSRYRADAEMAHRLAQSKSQPWLAVDPNVSLSNALVLVNQGQAEAALAILSATPGLEWNADDSIQQRINESFVWIRALEGCGCGAEARLWRERLQLTLRQRASRQLPWLVCWLDRFAANAVETEPSPHREERVFKRGDSIRRRPHCSGSVWSAPD